MKFKLFSFISLSLLSSIYIGLSALHRFEPFDMSMFLDVGYRMSIGQTLYKDVYYHAGPVFPHVAGFFFKYFGFSSSIVIWHIIVENFLFLISIYQLGYKRLSNVSLAVVLAFSGIVFYGLFPHPYYDQLSVLFVTFAILAIDHGLQSSRKSSWYFLAGILLGISFHTKANYGLFSLCIIFLFLLLKRSSFKEVFSYSVGSALSLIGIIALLDEPARYIYQAYFAYNPSSRVLDLDRFVSTLSSITFLQYLGMAILFVPLYKKFDHRDRDSYLLFVAIFFIAYFSTLTGSTPAWACSFIFCPGLVLLLSIKNIKSQSRLIGLQVITFIFIIFTTLFASLGGVFAFHPEARDRSWTMQSGQFKGWSCSKEWCPDFDRVYNFMKSRVGNSETVFIFPSMQFLYGLLQIPSYSPAPVGFHHEVLLVRGGLYEEFQSALKENLPTYIVRFKQTIIPFNDDQVIANWLQLDLLLAQHYQEIYSLNRFTIYQQIN